jgi:hypothetical protein
MTDTDLTYTFNKFVSQKLAKAGNGSFGLCEVFPFLDGNMLADDNIFLEAAVQGQNVFFRRAIPDRSAPWAREQTASPLEYRSWKRRRLQPTRSQLEGRRC